MRRQRSAVVTACMLVVAIGLSSVGSTAGAAASGSNYDPNGVLRRPYDMSVNGGLSFDPATMSTGEYQYAYPVLAAWLERDDKGGYSPWLAQKVDTPDASTIVVTMRPNLAFSNGEKLDATAAVNSINRTLAAKAPGLRVAEMALVASVTVDSQTQFTIKLNQPQVGLFYPLMADAETAPVAPASIAQNDRTSKTAIGAGPMKIDSYTPGVGVKMSKNDKYFQAKSVKLGGAEIVNVAAAPGNSVTALRSNTVDLVTPLTFSDRASLTAPIKLETRSINAPYWVNMCMKDGTPLGDIKIRQALNYATDRKDINEKVYDGEGRVAWSLFPGDDPVFGNPATDNAYPYNPKKAKKLLAEAGHADGLELTMITMPAGDTATIDQVVQAQWAKVGVKVDLKVTTNVAADWYSNPTGQLNTVPMIREGVSRLTRLVTSTAFANVCKYPVPSIDQAVQQLAGLPADDPEARKIWEQVNVDFTKKIADGVPTVFVLQTIAYNSDRVGGLAYHTDGILQWQPDYTKVFIKKGA
jgi:peptide/nickel transport system substrate-binding protein